MHTYIHTYPTSIKYSFRNDARILQQR
jgi:hypothetical protein